MKTGLLKTVAIGGALIVTNALSGQDFVKKVYAADVASNLNNSKNIGYTESDSSENTKTYTIPLGELSTDNDLGKHIVYDHKFGTISGDLYDPEGKPMVEITIEE